MDTLVEFDGTAESIRIDRVNEAGKKLFVSNALVIGKHHQYADVDTGEDFDAEWFKECSIKAFERALSQISNERIDDSGSGA